MTGFSKLRLVHVTDGRSRAESLHGGDVSIYHFTKSLAALGHDVRFVGVTRKEASPIPGVDSVSVQPSGIPLIASESFIKGMLEFEPDIIHFHGAYVPVNSAGSKVARKMGIPYVVTPHGNLTQDVLNRRAYLKKPYRAMFELPMLQHAMFVHAIADREAIREYGVTQPVEEARNGIDLPDDFKQSCEREGVTRFGVPLDQKVALYLGRLDQGQKGLDVLIDGFSEAREKIPNLHLILAGVDWKGDRAKLEAKIRDYALKESVTFTGAIYGEDKHAVLRDCDFFVHPSRWEAGVPFSILEALSYGKPCVITGDADPENLLMGTQCSVRVEMNAESMAEAITGLSALDQVSAGSIADEARSLCSSYFSWKATASQLTTAYLKYLANAS